jgi:putative transcriptional regulator
MITQVSTGDILLSSPLLLDSNFFKTVVLLTDHGKEGTFGLVLNRPGKLTLGEALAHNCPESLSDVNLFTGGPVRTNALFSIHHELESFESDNIIHVRNNIWFGGEKKILDLAENKLLPEDFGHKFFEGYSGWSAEQLDSEIKTGSWIVLKNYSLDLFNTESDQLYDRLIGSNAPTFN